MDGEPGERVKWCKKNSWEVSRGGLNTLSIDNPTKWRRQLVKLKEDTAAFYSREDTCCFNLSTLLIFIDLPLETFALGTSWIHITLILFVCFSGSEQVWRTHSSHVWLASSNTIRLQAETILQSESYLQTLMIQIASIWHFPIKKRIFLILACISLLFTLLELLMPHTWVHQSLIKTLSKTSTVFSQDSHSHELPDVKLTLFCPEVHLISELAIFGGHAIFVLLVILKIGTVNMLVLWENICRTVHGGGKLWIAPQEVFCGSWKMGSRMSGGNKKTDLLACFNKS